MQAASRNVDQVLEESEQLARAIQAGTLELSIPSTSGEVALADLQPDARAVDYIVQAPEQLG